ncbi:Sulfate/thiosulfate import ATP-binding protein CysA [Mannheimia haemolytica]|uniref:Sulfate/thiosulfate import ATP-binding protein CysA n=1 Tax=Mannheimia haemolytica TaxID=75985 RepID=A0A378MYC2_MANHA|nr:Sulfate/thiosulfate import ATP-binding protein CysA [Mannheimia haemolytica]
MLKLKLLQQLGNLTLNVNLDLPNKGITAIFGRSGAGKSSLINLIAGLSTAQAGFIELNGQVLFDSQNGINLPPEKRNIGYVFQEHRLFPHYSVEKNLKYGYKRSDSADFLQIVELLGIALCLIAIRQAFPVAKNNVWRLAGVIKLTEYFADGRTIICLDLPRKQELLDYLDKLSARLEIPILYVSHSLEEVVRLADHLVLLENGKVTAFDTFQRFGTARHFPLGSQIISELACLNYGGRNTSPL